MELGLYCGSHLLDGTLATDCDGWKCYFRYWFPRCFEGCNCWVCLPVIICLCDQESHFTYFSSLHQSVLSSKIYWKKPLQDQSYLWRPINPNTSSSHDQDKPWDPWELQIGAIFRDVLYREKFYRALLKVLRDNFILFSLACRPWIELAWVNFWRVWENIACPETRGKLPHPGQLNG